MKHDNRTEHGIVDDLDNHHGQKFHCPERIPAEVRDDRFGTDIPCPETIPTPRFSSPTSVLPPDELKELQRCIERVNTCLRTLGNPRGEHGHHSSLNDDGLRSSTELQHYFRHLRERFVTVQVECGAFRQKTNGRITDAGRDFLILRKWNAQLLIPYMNICAVQGRKKVGKMHAHRRFARIPQQLRRDLLFHFGETASQNKQLINLFFGLPLRMWLDNVIRSTVRVRIENETVQGLLTEVEEDQISIQTAGGRRNIHLSDICFVITNRLENDEIR